MSDQNKVVKFKKRRTINIGIIVFLILFVYIAINVYIYFTKPQLSIYEVHDGSTAIDNHITGIILRSERIVTSQKAGYITYYQKEGARVAKNEAIYSVDENGQLSNLVSGTDLPVTLTARNKADIKHEVRSFESNFNDNDFTGVYEFKESAQSTVLDILNTTVANKQQDLLAESGATFTYQMVPSEESGIVSYYMDSFENVTFDKVTDDMFDTKKYQRTSLRQPTALEINSPIYKIITSETWKLVLPLTKNQYEKLDGKEHVVFTILEDDLEMKAALTLEHRGSSYFAELTMDKYLSNYLNDRYLDIELDFDTVEGLKIPVTSIIDKDFSVVPKEFLCQGADSDDYGLTKKTYSENGDISYTFVAAQVYYDDDVNVYVDSKQFPLGTVIQSIPANSEDGSSTGAKEETISQTQKLQGVYNVNLGYAVFKRIEIITQNEDYCIINKNTKYGLSAYDQIALVASTAVDQAIIY